MGYTFSQSHAHTHTQSASKLATFDSGRVAEAGEIISLFIRRATSASLIYYRVRIRVQFRCSRCFVTEDDEFQRNLSCSIT